LLDYSKSLGFFDKPNYAKLKNMFCCLYLKRSLRDVRPYDWVKFHTDGKNYYPKEYKRFSLNKKTIQDDKGCDDCENCSKNITNSKTKKNNKNANSTKKDNNDNDQNTKSPNKNSENTTRVVFRPSGNNT